jgi:SAM-dependent methyltransferase
MSLSQKLFYNEQYRKGEYAVGVEDRAEQESIQAFVEAYHLKDKRILEIGCGRGAFQHLVKDWIGVDLAVSAADYLSKPFLAASAEALPFAEGSFDGIWSVAVLEHVPRPEKALQEIARVLKPGGVAYLAPAWHCRSWAADGYQVRPWSDFNWRGKLIKASIPLRDALWLRAAYTMPIRLWRDFLFAINRAKPTRFRYRPLKANYNIFWCADSDACNSMDPHEMLLWFQSRGWQAKSHSSWLARFLVRHGALIVQKPSL